MWWVAVLVPLVVLAIVIAVAPVAIGSVRFHRWHNRRLPQRPAQPGRPSRMTGRRRVRCPICAAQLEGTTANQAIAARNEHLLETHVTSEPDVEQRPA